MCSETIEQGCSTYALLMLARAHNSASVSGPVTMEARWLEPGCVSGSVVNESTGVVPVAFSFRGLAAHRREYCVEHACILFKWCARVLYL